MTSVTTTTTSTPTTSTVPATKEPDGGTGSGPNVWPFALVGGAVLAVVGAFVLGRHWRSGSAAPPAE